MSSNEWNVFPLMWIEQILGIDLDSGQIYDFRKLLKTASCLTFGFKIKKKNS